MTEYRSARRIPLPCGGTCSQIIDFADPHVDQSDRQRVHDIAEAEQ